MICSEESNHTEQSRSVSDYPYKNNLRKLIEQNKMTN